MLPAPACQGHQGCVFWIPFASQQLSDMLSAISHLLLSCLQATIRDFFPPAPSPLGIRYTTKNPSIFKPVSKAAKIRKAAQSLPKTKKKDGPKTMEILCQTPLRPSCCSQATPKCSCGAIPQAALQMTTARS